MARDYAFYQRQYTSKNATATILAATDDTTLVTAKSANHTIYVQKIHITTYSAKTWNFEDSNGTPKDIAHVSIPAAAVALPSESNAIVHDFGPEGIALTEGKNLVLDVSAAGAAGIVTVEAYEKLTAASNYLSGASLQ
jgi:hypothetical protein